jgi:hypothetical protein
MLPSESFIKYNVFILIVLGSISSLNIHSNVEEPGTDTALFAGTVEAIAGIVTSGFSTAVNQFAPILGL